MTLLALMAFRGLRARLTHDALRRRVIIIGTGPRAVRIYRALSADFLTPYRVLGFVDSPNAAVSVPNSFIARRTLGRLEDLETLLVRRTGRRGPCRPARQVALPTDSEHHPDVRAPRCESALPRRYRRHHARQAAHADARTLVRTCSCRWRPKGCSFASSVASMSSEPWARWYLLAPLMLAAAAAIRLTSDGPVIYAQERYGLNRRRFRMFKFRTMVAGRGTAAGVSRSRRTRPRARCSRSPTIRESRRWDGFFGARSIDELPQLFNVLRGDMSLVGPRPLAVARRHALHPHRRLATVQHAARRDLPVADQRTQRHRLR